MESDTQNKILVSSLAIIGLILVIGFFVMSGSLTTDINSLKIEAGEDSYNLTKDATVYVADGDNITVTKPDGTDITSDVSFARIDGDSSIEIRENMTVAVDDSVCNIEYEYNGLGEPPTPRVDEIASVNYTVSYGFQETVVEFRCSPWYHF